MPRSFHRSALLLFALLLCIPSALFAQEASVDIDASIDASETPTDASNTDASSVDAPPEEPTEATLVFLGDVIPHQEVLAAMTTHGPQSLFHALEPVLRAADLALVNLETPVVPSRPPTQVSDRFNAPASFLTALRNVGIDGVSAANNHAFDQGIDGVGETVRALRSSGLRSIGAVLPNENPLAPQVFSLAGSTVCIFAVTRLLNFPMELPNARRPRIALARTHESREENALLNALREHRSRCGAIVASLHSGEEYAPRMGSRDQAFFRRVAEAGADVVIGHHPHVPYEAQWIDTEDHRHVPLFFSLGNALSNQGASADVVLLETPSLRPQLALDERTRTGLLSFVRFERVAPQRLQVRSAAYLPLWTINTHRSTARGRAPRIQAALLPREGANDRGLARVWTRTITTVGAALLGSSNQIPGANEAYRRSNALVQTYREQLRQQRRH